MRERERDGAISVGYFCLKVRAGLSSIWSGCVVVELWVDVASHVAHSTSMYLQRFQPLVVDQSVVTVIAAAMSGANVMDIGSGAAGSGASKQD